jgi:phosphoribosyl 1,2-cyclic phosphodiesterase
MMQVRFWGVRGSVPWGTPESVGYGCNTACLELVDQASGEMLIIDAGTGIVGLGQSLKGEPRNIPLLLTHYHWDHLQGLPFLSTLYRPGWSTTVWAPVFESHDDSWLAGIFRSPYFPVSVERLPNRPGIQNITAGSFTIGAFDVCAIALNHPGGALAYRVRGSRGDLVFATDHEFGLPQFDEPLADFVRGARAIIVDAQFTRDEGPAHRGWGHSTWCEAAEFAAAHEVGRLWLFHHNPGRTDAELTQIETSARGVFSATAAAAEGDVFEV